MSRVHDAAAAARRLAWLVADDPIASFDWLPLQMRYRRSTSRFRVLRTGNQVLGKTTAGMADLVEQARGVHPWRPDAGPGTYWVVCVTWPQSLEIQAKLHAMINPKWLTKQTKYSPKGGFAPRNSPSLGIIRADGRVSTIRFLYASLADGAMAGASLRGVVIDEGAASERKVSELRNRLKTSGGWLSILLTPINFTCEHIEKLCENGVFEDIHADLTPAELTHVSGRTRTIRLDDGTEIACDADWIADQYASAHPWEADIVIHGHWRSSYVGAYFDRFSPKTHLIEKMPPGTWNLRLGVDHGSRPGKQIAALVLERSDSDGRVSVVVWDEYTDAAGVSGPEQDADGILAMLARNGWSWANLDSANGDIVHMQGTSSQKSNRDLDAWIRKRTKMAELYPKIRSVKLGEMQRGAVRVGGRWLAQRIATPGGFAVHSRCTRIIEALKRYSEKDDEWKDPIDAVRYALRPVIAGWGSRSGPTEVRVTP